MSDKEILDLYNDGRREQAFNEIVKTYSERLYWQVRPLVGSHEDADDVIQEVFIKIWTALPSFRGEAQFFTWLYRIALNTAITYAKKQKRRSAEPLFDAGGGAPDVAGDPFFDGDKASRLISSAIMELPPKQRAVFSMRYFDEMPYEQISAVLGSSVGALKASYHFAFEKIKKKLGGDI